MERLTNKREADAQREDYERRLANGYPRNIPEERFLRLAAYEDTELTSEEVSALIKDWIRLCTTIRECGGIDRLRVLADADKGGRLVVLPVKPVLTPILSSMLYISRTETSMKMLFMKLLSGCRKVGRRMWSTRRFPTR